jgi:hypothetical protein
VKQLTFGYRITQTPDLLALAKQRTVELAEMTEASAEPISAEWDQTTDGEGKPVVTLRLSDFAGSATTVFDPQELESFDRMRLRVYLLWSALLQERLDRQFQELHESGVLEGA